MSRRNEYLDGKVYIGGLPDDASSEEIEDAFRRYGKIRKVWVARRPPGFAFVEFEDSRDAEDAVKSLDGTKICGVRAKVELSHGRSRGGGGGGGRGHRGDRPREDPQSAGPDPPVAADPDPPEETIEEVSVGPEAAPSARNERILTISKFDFKYLSTYFFYP